MEVAGDERAARAILRLDADPDAILARLGPTIRCSARRCAPRRAAASPGHPDPAELAVRALLGQQISVAAARTLAGRLVAAVGEPLERAGGRDHASLPDAGGAGGARSRRRCPMPRARARALVGMAGKPFGTHLPGVGPWTAAYVALRSGDDDAFLPTDLGVKHGLAALGRRPGAAREGSSPRRVGAPTGATPSSPGLWAATSS